MEKASESTGPVVKFSAPYGDIQVRKGHVAGKEKKNGFIIFKTKSSDSCTE